MMPKDSNEKLMLIKELMDELVGDMEYGADEFDSRLGKKKPEVEIKVESEELMPEEGMMEEEDDEDAGFMKRIMALKK